MPNHPDTIKQIFGDENKFVCLSKWQVNGSTLGQAVATSSNEDSAANGPGTIVFEKSRTPGGRIVLTEVDKPIVEAARDQYLRLLEQHRKFRQLYGE